MKMTLSETITYMIDERESKAQYEHQISAMKAGLKDLLNELRKRQGYILVFLLR